MRPRDRIQNGHYQVVGYDIHCVNPVDAANRNPHDWLVVLDGELIGARRTLAEAKSLAHADRAERTRKPKVWVE